MRSLGSRLLFPLTFTVLGALGHLAVGCSASGTSDGGPSGGGSGATSGSGASGGTAGTGGGFGGTGGDLLGDGGDTTPTGQVYGHSPDTLYEVEPYSKTVSVVGRFDCLGGGEMWDIAVDAQGGMLGSVSSGVGSGMLVRINPKTASCTHVANGAFPNSLGYIPVGGLDPDVEALVGYNVSQYIRIKPDTGEIFPIGDLNPNPTGQTWVSSGDVVSVQGGKTYLTVHLQFGGDTNDSLAEIDPKTGKVVRIIGQTGYSQLYGLGYWANTAYGFSATGVLISINLDTGAGTPIPLPSIPSGLSFYGAGTTTSAPIR